MITDEDIDDFLEHFGVKGMKWGKRKQQSTEKKNNKPKLSTEQKVKLGVALAAVTIAGAQLAKNHMAKNGRKKTSTIPQFTGAFRASGPGFLIEAGRGTSTANINAAVRNARPAGPIGSTSIPRLNGAIPMSRIKIDKNNAKWLTANKLGG